MSTLLSLSPAWANSASAWLFAAIGAVALVWALIPAAPQRQLAQIIAAAAIGYACYLTGYAGAQAACEADKLRAQLAATQRDLDAARAAETDARRRADILDETLRANQDQIDEYETELAKRPNAACGLSDDDLRRLHNLKP